MAKITTHDNKVHTVECINQEMINKMIGIIFGNGQEGLISKVSSITTLIKIVIVLNLSTLGAIVAAFINHLVKAG